MKLKRAVLKKENMKKRTQENLKTQLIRHTKKKEREQSKTYFEIPLNNSKIYEHTSFPKVPGPLWTPMEPPSLMTSGIPK